MTTDDLRTRARGEAHHRCYDRAASVAFSEGALWHAAQQPSREEVATAIYADDIENGRTAPTLFRSLSATEKEWYLTNADAVLRLLNGEDNA